MEKAQLVKQVVELQRQVNKILHQQTPEAWMELSVTVGQLKSLFFIANEGVVNLRKLAAALGVTPANVTGIVDRLVEQGLVKRTENPEDRRMLLLQVTEKGQTLLTNLRESQTLRLSDILTKMSLEELSALYCGLVALVRVAENNREKQEVEHSRG